MAKINMKGFQPFPYQGSKRKIASQILPFLPEDTQHLIEPFAGSAAVSLRALVEDRAERVLLNDVNEPLIALWREIAHRPEELADAYETLWREQLGDRRAFYDRVRDRFNEERRPDDLLYLLARCVKASVRYNAKGEFNQSPDNRRKGTRPKTMRERIRSAAHLLQNRAEFTATDYRETLAQATSQDVVYLDPPYQGVCADRDPRYLEGVSFEEFAEALAGMNERGVAFVLSYDGRTGEREYGRTLPEELDLKHMEIDAGRSSQATLLGRDANTYESLYLSPALARHMPDAKPTAVPPAEDPQLAFSWKKESRSTPTPSSNG